MNTLENKPKVLIHAYGNPGRGDDGLGDTFIQMCQPWLSHESAHHITTESSFQLNVEDAYTMSEFDIVVFVDATKEKIENFSFAPVKPVSQSPFTTHAMSPSGVLYLCNELYGKLPETYLLQVKGYEWEMLEGLSEKAEKNLWKAFHFFRVQLEEWIHSEREHEQEHA
ncbi:MAG: hydrogenase maturation protease [Bacteroidota bacterium]